MSDETTLTSAEVMAKWEAAPHPKSDSLTLAEIGTLCQKGQDRIIAAKARRARRAKRPKAQKEK